MWQVLQAERLKALASALKEDVATDTAATTGATSASTAPADRSSPLNGTSQPADIQ